MLLDIGIILVVVVLFFELLTWSVIGLPTSTEPDFEDWFKSKHLVDKENEMIHFWGGQNAQYITLVPFPLFTKWYIDYDYNECRTVWRWSKLHKQIEKHYDNS